VSRPETPSYSTPTWASTTVTYPAGPEDWAGSATCVAPAGDVFTPEGRIPADHLNDLFKKALQGSVNAKTSLTALVNFIGQAAFTNFRPGVSVSANSLLWVPSEGNWYSLGSSDNVRRSSDYGATWSASSEVSGGTARTVVRGAASPSEIVALTLSRDVYRKNAGAWVKHVNALPSLPDTFTTPRIVYDSVAGLFIAAYANSSTIKIATSPTGVTWTARSLPGAWSAGHTRAGIATFGGRTVLVARQSAADTASSVATSDDGGVTWTARSSLTHVSLDTSQDENRFLDTLGMNGSTVMYIACDTKNGGAEVFTSSNGGETFTSALSFATARTLLCPLPFGVAWVAMSGTPEQALALEWSGEARLLYSLDAGATWLDSGVDVAGKGLQALVPGDGGFAICTNSGGAHMGFRCAAPGREVIA
jgi:hypothetical protein